jgi:hypothetical protein
MIEEASALRESEKRRNYPVDAPWVEKAERCYEESVSRVNAMRGQTGWDGETRKQLQAVFDNHWSWTLAWLGLCGKPEPRAKIRWFAIFPDWLALIPADLQLPALLELQKARPNHGCNWLEEWLRFLSWDKLTIPESLTMEPMGIIIRTVVENSDALGIFTTYCKKCALLYPMREGQPSRILPSCPNCGNAEYAYVHAFG